MNELNVTSINLEPKIEKEILTLKKTMEDILLITLLGVVIPIVIPCMIALGAVYTYRRKKILNNEHVKAWLLDNSSIDLKVLAKQPTVQGGIARIKISAWRPWIPLLFPTAAIAICIVLLYAMGVM